MVTAWYYNTEDDTDPRQPHKFTPNRPISMDLLDKVGVLQFHFNPETEMDKVKDLMKKRNYSSSDQVLKILMYQFLQKNVANAVDKYRERTGISRKVCPFFILVVDNNF